MDLRHSLLATLVAVLWGFNFVVIEWGMHGVPPLLFVSLRFAAVVVPAVSVVPRPAASWHTVHSPLDHHEVEAPQNGDERGEERVAQVHA